MHGKGGSPKYLAATKTVLVSHHYLVATPEMCWSDRRMYDQTYPDCLTEIDAAVSGLRHRGAKSIVIAGHSIGGAAAVAYAASHEDIIGVIGYAAGDAFRGPHAVLPDIARARTLMDEGQGDALGEFGDIRPSGRIQMRTTARHYLSFVFQPPEQMMLANVTRLHAPLLLIAGTRDVNTLRYDSRAIEMAPPHTLNRFVEVDADHGGTVPAGMRFVLDWLAALMRQS